MQPAGLPQALVLLDYFGIAVFAVSGALLAAERRQTLVTFFFFAMSTLISKKRNPAGYEFRMHMKLLHCPLRTKDANCSD